MNSSRQFKFDKKKEKLKKELLKRQHDRGDNDKKAKFSVSQILTKTQELIDTYQYDLALKFCLRAVEREPTNDGALQLSAFLQLQLGNYEEASKAYRDLISLNPDGNPSNYFSIAQLSQGSEALHLYLKGIDVLEKNPPSETKEKNTFKKENKSEEEEEDEEGKWKRKLSEAHASIAELYMTDLCDEKEAEVKCLEELEKAVKSDSSNPEPFHLLSSYWLILGNKEKSEEWMRKGLNLWLPSNHSNHTSLMEEMASHARVSCSKTLIELSLYDEASEILEFLLDENEEYIEAWYLLGWLNYLKGEDYKSNVKSYISKGLQLAKKIGFDDEGIIDHMEEIMKEVESFEEEEEEETNGVEEENDDEVMETGDAVD